MKKSIIIILALTASFLIVRVAAARMAADRHLSFPSSMGSAGILKAGQLQAPAAAAAPQRTVSLQTPAVRATMDHGRMPLYFIANKGQTDKQVAYYVQGMERARGFLPLLPSGSPAALSVGKEIERGEQ